MNGDDRVAELLEELVAWTKFAHQEAITGAWKKVLSDEKHLMAYELSDGTKSQSEVGTASGLSQPTVSSLWQKWRRMGLGRDMPNKKFRHLAKPSDLGVMVAGSKKGGKAEESDA